ncbi:hypothetical protein CANMA_005270 [Candida margitis]|uniref:uncharacterized protein n=1 Tax=Candida margitis TaxID=1775924 RepID=UPI002226E08E|nr:uncharacterized protein CANMA_005270 [Candida margitis]KAI5950610.1 hypothetical protein CANMA_005270 [Candida margitis]
MKFGQRVQEFIYSLSTDDKYSEYDSRKSFNRVNKPDSENLLGMHSQISNSSVDSINNIIANEPNDSYEGVHEMKLAWRHIKHWLVKYAPDLNSSLSSKCTTSDMEDFQKDLRIKLPQSVLQFFKITDGQSNFGNQLNMDTNGLIFGLKLMSLDEIMIQTENWRKVADYINTGISHQNHKANEPSKLPTSHASTSQYKKKLSLNTSSELSSARTSFDLTDEQSRKTSVSSHGSDSSSGKSAQNHSKMPKQRSIPPNMIYETFAHPMWIPLVTDEVGNYIGIDLSPASAGKWGQVILFGRDFDFKFQIADTWGDFLLIFANDLEMGNWDIKANQKNNDGDLFIGNEGEIVFVDKESKLEVPYLEVLKRRAVKKWMTMLENEPSENINKELLDELKHNEVSILALHNKSFQPIDAFITRNLNLLDHAKTSEIAGDDGDNDNKPAQKSDKPAPSLGFNSKANSSKSPLSQEVTEADEEVDDVDETKLVTDDDKTLQEVDIRT